jgi:hypothetical protein
MMMTTALARFWAGFPSFSNSVGFGLGYSVDKESPENLLFSNEAILTRYRHLMNAAVVAGQLEMDAKASLVKSQKDRTESLTNLSKR